MEAAETLPPTITPMLTALTEEAVSPRAGRRYADQPGIVRQRAWRGAITPPPEVVRAKFRAPIQSGRAARSHGMVL